MEYFWLTKKLEKNRESLLNSQQISLHFDDFFDMIFPFFTEDFDGQKDKEEMVKESGRATDQLKAISRNLAQTVENSSRTMDELVTSSKTLNEANEEFKGHASVVGQGRKLITKYVRRGVTDQFLILMAAAFFFAVVFYILRKRVLGPLDPFSLIWSSIVAFVQTLLNLLIPKEELESDEIPTQTVNIKNEL